MLIFADVRAVRDYVALLDETAPVRADASSGAPRQLVPARQADALLWVQLAREARSAHLARLRHTRFDNAPAGRDVHWSSVLGWLLRAAAHTRGNAQPGEDVANFERVLPWFNAALLVTAIVVFSTWTATRAGAGAGVLIALALVGHRRFYEGFAPFYVDHHGLVNAAVLGLLLGFAFMGAGWWRAASSSAATWLPTSLASARRAAIVSAVCGAFGLWISAAATLPAIALLGLSGAVVAWNRRRKRDNDEARFEPALWRLWGSVGAVTSAAFYLVEYAPAHLGLRLEVNHPLWSLGWWGGAELVAVIGAGGRRPARLVWALLAIAAAPAAIVCGGPATFLVADPFVGDLRHFVAEGKSLLAAAAHAGFGRIAYDCVSALVLAPGFIVAARARGEARIVAGALALVTAGFVLMACAEMRWWLNAASAEIVLLLSLVAATKPGRRWAVIVVLATGLFAAPAISRIARERAENRGRVFDERDLLQPLYRDLAATLRMSSPDRDIVLLADPNASLGIAYFARARTLGTLYWENAPGLRAAAEIFCAETDAEAAQLVRARGVTHIVAIARANFTAEYLSLLRPGALRADAARAFGVRLEHEPPPWLQAVPYRVPAALADVVGPVKIFKVAFEQSDGERLFQAAVAHAAAGDTPRADAVLADTLSRAPREARFAVAEAAANAFYDFGADASAARAFRRALEIRFEPEMATTLAWILATSADDHVRDGRAALALVESRARTAAADVLLLSAFAAASAEIGRFPDAIVAAERALAGARAAGDGAAATLLQRRLDSYRAGRPWRQ